MIETNTNKTLTNMKRYHPRKDYNKLFLAEVIGPSGTKWHDLVKSIDPYSAQTKVEKYYLRPGSNIKCKVYISTIIE